MLSLAWQIISWLINRRFSKKVHLIEQKIYACGVCNDVYNVQIKPIIRNIIKHTPPEAKLNPKTYSAAEKIYDQLFHVYNTMQDLEKIDKENAERMRLFLSNSILWSCHFIESIYQQCDPVMHEGHIFSMFRACRSLEVTNYFSKNLPNKANTSTNYDADIFAQ